MEASLLKFARMSRRFMEAGEVSTIFELGARDCEESLGFCQRFPKAVVHAFECNPDTLPACRRAAAQQPRIRLVEKAVSNQAGTLTFMAVDKERSRSVWADGNPGASSLFKVDNQWVDEEIVQKEIRVEAIRLDGYLESQGIPKVDLMWMDIQGAELMALKGLGARLADVSLIHMEVEFRQLYVGQPLFQDLKAFLNAQGFSLVGFTSFHRVAGDAVFANNRLNGGRPFSSDRWLYWRHKFLGTHYPRWAYFYLAQALRRVSEKKKP